MNHLYFGDCLDFLKRLHQPRYLESRKQTFKKAEKVKGDEKKEQGRLFE